MRKAEDINVVFHQRLVATRKYGHCSIAATDTQSLDCCIEYNINWRKFVPSSLKLNHKIKTCGKQTDKTRISRFLYEWNHHALTNHLLFFIFLQTELLLHMAFRVKMAHSQLTILTYFFRWHKIHHRVPPLIYSLYLFIPRASSLQLTSHNLISSVSTPMCTPTAHKKHPLWQTVSLSPFTKVEFTLIALRIIMVLIHSMPTHTHTCPYVRVELRPDEIELHSISFPNMASIQPFVLY